MKLNRVWQSTLLLAILGTSFLTSCKKTPDVTPLTNPTILSSTVVSGVVTDQEVNDWILANMKYYYLWNEKLPASTDRNQTPDNYFLSLLYDRNNTAN